MVTSREQFSGLEKLISDGDFIGPGKAVYEAIKEYYDNDPAAVCVDIEILANRLKRGHPKIAELVDQITSNLENLSAPNIIQEYIEFKKEIISQELSVALATQDGSKIDPLIEEYQRYSSIEDEVLEDQDQVFNGESFTFFTEALKPGALIPLSPVALNDAVGGGVPPQTHILVFAEPETGKSLFAINLAAFICKAGHRVLYVGNEDPSYAMLARFGSRFSMLTKAEIMDAPAQAEAKARNNGYENLIFASMAPGTIREITELVERHRPTVLIVDQIRHVYVRGAESEQSQLAAMGKAMRTLAKKYNLVAVSVHQAADSASGKKYLDRGDVYMSNTSLPGDADLMIGVGADEDYLRRGLRMLSLCKNKLTGNHDPIQITVQPQWSRVVP